MNNSRSVFSLRVFHPSIDPEEISEGFGLAPRHSRRAGEERKTPKGQSLSGTYNTSYWMTELTGDESGRGDLTTALRDIANRLRAYEFFVKKIRDEGGRVEIFIGWLLEGNDGFVLDNALMARFAELGIDLSFDVYPPQDPERRPVQ
jgi:hypothetical protein